MRIFVLSGDKFDIKDYHHVLLSAGPMGLDTLEEAVDEYIDSTLAQWTQELLTAAITVRMGYSIPKFREFYFQLIPKIIKYALDYQLILFLPP